MKRYILRIAMILAILIIALSCKKENFKSIENTFNTAEVKKSIKYKMGRQNLKEKKKEPEVLYDANLYNNNNHQNKDQIENNSDIKEIINHIEEENKNDSGFNLDLTDMHPDMIFATVFMIVEDPDSVRGRTIKVKGNLYTFPTPDGKSTTQYCVIKDALKCCAQGLHLVPKTPFKNIPADDTQILVEGTLEPYSIDGVPMKLCRIKDANVKIIE